MLQTIRGNQDFTPSLDPSHHISMFALSNTVSRLAAGLISDYVSSPHRIRSMSRIPLLLLLSLCQVFALFLLAYSPISWLSKWFSVGSVLIGIGYGGMFTLAPTVVSVVWGIGGFGRNWGFLTFTPGTRNSYKANSSAWCNCFWASLRTSVRRSFATTSSNL
jgi:MFS family permease